MRDVVRNDLFKADESSQLPFGYVVLRKEAYDTNDELLPRVDVYRHSMLFNRDALYIISEDLYTSINDGDIGFVNARGGIRVILSSKANHNTLLVTERCDNRCLFCSQPPKEKDDSWLLTQAALALATFKTEQTVGISGGEPLLYGDMFVGLLATVSELTPKTPLHILSNGRGFRSAQFTEKISIYSKLLNLSFGIPLYGTTASTHDQLVGATGAFEDTIIGLINAGNAGIALEIRFIPTRENYKELPEVVRLVSHCLSNVVQISVMNLEPTGWAKHNWDTLYISPSEYQNELTEAIQIASSSKLPLVLFNYPLCHISEKLWSYAVKSISDWKNYFTEECVSCSQRENCTGFFSSSMGRYHIPARSIT